MRVCLLDTSTVVDFIRGNQPQVEARLRTAERSGQLVVSSVVEYELSYGAERKPDPRPAYEAIRRFLHGPVARVDFDHMAALESARVRRELERSGRRIGHYDLLIAGHARAYGWTVVTSNRDEISRVAGLVWEDWRA